MASPPAAWAGGTEAMPAAHARAAAATAANTIVGREVLRRAPAAALACNEVMARLSPPPSPPAAARRPVSRTGRSHVRPRRAVQAHHRRTIGLRHPPPQGIHGARGVRRIYKELSGVGALPQVRGRRGRFGGAGSAGRRIRITAGRPGLASAGQRHCGRGACPACNAALAADTGPSRGAGMPVGACPARPARPAAPVPPPACGSRRQGQRVIAGSPPRVVQRSGHQKAPRACHSVPCRMWNSRRCSRRPAFKRPRIDPVLCRCLVVD